VSESLTPASYESLFTPQLGDIIAPPTEPGTQALFLCKGTCNALTSHNVHENVNWRWISCWKCGRVNRVTLKGEVK
jgi:hypothetical protein